MAGKTDKPSDGQPEFFSRQVSNARRFYLEMRPKSRHPLVVLCGGIECCQAHYSIHRKDFPFHSIEVVARGRGSLELNGRQHPLHTGKVFTYGPGIAQDITTDPSETLVKYFVDFSGSGAPALLKAHQQEPGSVLQIRNPGEVFSLLDDLIANGLKGTPYSQAICQTMLRLLILKIAETSVPPGSTETPAFATYQHCRQYVMEHFENLQTMDEMARACHVAPAYLCRLFRRYDHQSPYQFLLRLKLNRAAELLHTRPMLVKEVAARMGFSDAFHFSRAFKGLFGLPPEKFRRLR